MSNLATTRQREVPDNIADVIARMRAGESHSHDHVMGVLRNVASAYVALGYGCAKPMSFVSTAGTDGWCLTLNLGHLRDNVSSRVSPEPTDAACDLLERLVGRILSMRDAAAAE